MFPDGHGRRYCFYPAKRRVRREAPWTKERWDQMHKRYYVIGALAATIAVSGIGGGIASGARTVNQLTTADVCPPANVPCTKALRTKKRKFKPARLHVLLAARDSADPEACRVTPDTTGNERGCRVPPASDNVKVDFDNDIRFNPDAVGKCSPGTINGDSTATARSECAGALIGTGSGFGRFGSVGTVGAGDVPVTLSAFNSQANDRIIFHVDPGFAPFDLTGRLVGSPAGRDYGTRLDTDVVAANVLVRFDININRGRFVRARCKDRNKKFNFKFLFHYGDQGIAPNNYPETTATSDVDSCKRIKPRRRR